MSINVIVINNMNFHEYSLSIHKHMLLLNKSAKNEIAYVVIEMYKISTKIIRNNITIVVKFY